MALRIFDFLCQEGHLHEHFVSYEVTEVSCETCSKPALKQLSTPNIKLEPYSGIFVGAADKWARNRAEKLKQEQKQNQA
jgi:hypothetical protein